MTYQTHAVIPVKYLSPYVLLEQVKWEMNYTKLAHLTNQRAGTWVEQAISQPEKRIALADKMGNRWDAGYNVAYLTYKPADSRYFGTVGTLVIETKDGEHSAK